MRNPLFVVEARDAEGNLVQDKDKQPPFTVASENQLYNYYCENKGPGEYSLQAMVDWYNSKGWFIRKRNW